MSRPIRGTQDMKNYQASQVVSGPSVKITCPKCRAPAFPGAGAGTGNNTPAYTCTGCGATFSAQRI